MNLGTDDRVVAVAKVIERDDEGDGDEAGGEESGSDEEGATPAEAPEEPIK